MAKHRKPKDFLRLPQYEGGKEALKKFIDNNLIYPEEALKNKIEGTVEAEYFVNGLGDVKEVNIIQGIGYGCDEEVVRLLKTLVYQKAVNRGIKTLTRKTIKIHFNLPKKPKSSIQYQLVKSKPNEQVKPKKKEKTYTINIKFGNS